MTRNTKIALGCGGGGCLVLILVVLLGVILVVSGVIKAPGLYSPSSNYNSNYNRNSNYNANTNLNTNSNSSSSSTMSEDDKHKLFQAAGASKDHQIMLRMLTKIGFPTGTEAGYTDFVKAHFPWAKSNLEFMETVNTPAKARAYFEAHIDD